LIKEQAESRDNQTWINSLRKREGAKGILDAAATGKTAEA